MLAAPLLLRERTTLSIPFPTQFKEGLVKSMFTIINKHFNINRYYEVIKSKTVNIEYNLATITSSINSKKLETFSLIETPILNSPVNNTCQSKKILQNNIEIINNIPLSNIHIENNDINNNCDCRL